MESLGELKAIFAGKPDGAQSVMMVCNPIYVKLENGFWYAACKGQEWLQVTDKQIGNMRSLSDIERIIELMEDEIRLDHLQKCNEAFNKRAGSNYGWRVDWNHNRIALIDTGASGVSVRKAIDDHVEKVGSL